MVARAAQESDPAREKALSVIVAVSFCHLLNDVIQSLLASLCPLFKTS